MVNEGGRAAGHGTRTDERGALEREGRTRLRGGMYAQGGRGPRRTQEGDMRGCQGECTSGGGVHT
jgi:hypothetical protein